MTKESKKPEESGEGEESPDRRRHPRVYEDLPAEATLADGGMMKLSLQSLGLGGARLNCNEEEMRRIKAGGHPALHGQTVEIDLRVSLPTYDRASEALEATCRLVYTRRVTQRRYCLGMQFTGFKGQSRNALMHYLLDAG